MVVPIRLIMKKTALFIFILLPFITFSELKFNPIALNNNFESLFNSIEIIAGNEYNKTLFYSYKKDSNYFYKAMSFLPEKLYYSPNDKRLYIHNRMGLYIYDYNTKKINVVTNYPNFENKDEYSINKLSWISFSPNFKYMLAKISTSATTGDLYLFDLEKNTKEPIIKDIDISTAKPIAFWSYSSNYFVYEKGHSTYYFSINDYKRKKLLIEDFRLIGNVRLNNTFWTKDDCLIWIEDDLIYKADSRQFYSRSIYKKYLKLGDVIGKSPFSFDAAFDSFKFNEFSKKFLIVKNYKSIFYYTLNNDVIQETYMQLDNTTRFYDAEIFDNGDAVLTVDKLNKGEIIKKIFITKNINNKFDFKEFSPEEIKNSKINNIAVSKDKKQFVINTDKGSYCYDLASLSLTWKFENEEILSTINIDFGEWVLGGKYTTYDYIPSANILTPLFASSFDDAGFINNKIGVTIGTKRYIIDKDKRVLSQNPSIDYKLYKETKIDTDRLISREIKKGFYKEAVYIKNLYTGKQVMITGEPNLRYKLYQPELDIGVDYYDAPSGTKYEVALIFDCIKSDEGVFPILSDLKDFNINATFFINGSFMDINRSLTKELSYFNIEIGNLFQYYVNLTDNDFLIDKNFIRQGLSTNEEKFYKITGKNFSPIWHSPRYFFNDNIVKYGLESGYKFVTFNLDSLDWTSIDDADKDSQTYKKNAELIERIITNLKPGQIIVFNVGKNDFKRYEWLFNDLDILLSELVRSGYSFTTVTDLMKKYRK
jgi:peptidoglycan/xylan/chitin deacetylase (PgdA/CDA1 family)